MDLLSGLTVTDAGASFSQPTALDSVRVLGAFVASGPAALSPLEAPRPIIHTPRDDGIAAGQGDDTSAPNATTAARLNRIVCVAAANVGYSHAARDASLPPCAVEYDAIVDPDGSAGAFALTLRIMLEYESSFPKEGMVVWLKKYQQVICDERPAELMMIETSFQDLVDGRWEDISTEVRYTEEAESVVQAVMTTSSGQTAGRVKAEGAVEDVKFGPVGERGRILLTYRCEQLYSYAEMAVTAADRSGRRTLVPLALQLPWAALDNPANACSVKAVVHAPDGVRLLDPKTNVLAYLDLQRSLREGAGAEAASQVLVVPGAAAVAAMEDGLTWEFVRPSLPPRPTLVLAWLSFPDADVDDDWEEVRTALPHATRVTLLHPRSEDAGLLAVGAPGAQSAHLVRCKVEIEAPQRPQESVRVHTDILISDASGSTAMQVRGGAFSGETVRGAFSSYEERRLLMRLEAIPKLCEAGILLRQDFWNLVFVIFDHGVRHEFVLETMIDDLDAETVSALLRAIKDSDSAAENRLRSRNKGHVLDKWRQAIQSLRDVKPGGTTSFTEGAKAALRHYVEVARKHGTVGRTTYVNFDTDGGNNCGPCYDAISQLVSNADVVQGHVMGIGAWVDQDCASRVAKLLKGSTSLSLAFPESGEIDLACRQDLSRWIRVLRTTPVTLKVSAGCVTWEGRQGERYENGIDALFAQGSGLKFGQPDVSEMTFTKSVLGGLQAGEGTTLYLLSHRPLGELRDTLRVEIDGVRAQVFCAPEPLAGIALGHRWLTLLGGQGPPSQKVATNCGTLCTRLRQRLEDDVSFAWNLPSKSGSTAAVGRAKTAQRLPVSLAKQPVEPQMPVKPVAEQRYRGGLLGAAASHHGVRYRGGGGPPCRPLPAASQVTWRSPPSMHSDHGREEGRASNQRESLSAFDCRYTYSEETTRGCGIQQQQATVEACRRIKRCSSNSSDDAAVLGSNGPLAPSQLLELSGHMRLGAPEVCAGLMLEALRFLAKQAQQGEAAATRSTKRPAGCGADADEDPLVASLLGPTLSTAAVGPAKPGGAARHLGFECDATRMNPIVGVRYKATTVLDVDITEECRFHGHFPSGAAGWKAIPDDTTALGWALAAVLSWWPLLWPDCADLFGDVSLPTKVLSAADAAAAVLRLPDPNLR